ncbi:MAG: methylmalonyl Co-A mutase-associated GTPase MeaB [Bacteroidetes bacterium]|jgi:LAO/AO transport system kinase|nr:methylmalonyl Co-A mutase-associated GTPase MeaB [Bacteroidota bacterium]
MPDRDSGSDDTALHLTSGVDGAPSINPTPRRRSRRTRSVDDYVEGILAGDRIVLSRAITLIESTRPDHQAMARTIVERCLPHIGETLRVGITGVPGVGKSTFIEALGTGLTEHGHRLAVLAIDPSSERSKGSILGDKTRMGALSADENAFIRPSPTGGSLGGVARKTRETILLCEAAGYDIVFVETVGVGQSEIAVHSMVDFFLLLALTGAGDELQGIKRGIIEMADAIVITKADGPNAKRARETRGQYRNALHLFPARSSGWKPKVLTCSAVTGEGIDAVWTTVREYEQLARDQSTFAQRRREQAQYWMHQTIEDRLRTEFFNDGEVQQALETVEQAVRAGQMSSVAAAERLLQVFSGDLDPADVLSDAESASS